MGIRRRRPLLSNQLKMLGIIEECYGEDERGSESHLCVSQLEVRKIHGERSGRPHPDEGSRLHLRVGVRNLCVEREVPLVAGTRLVTWQKVILKHAWMTFCDRSGSCSDCDYASRTD